MPVLTIWEAILAALWPFAGPRLDDECGTRGFWAASDGGDAFICLCGGTCWHPPPNAAALSKQIS